jgi:hypothetical protein
MGWVTDAFRWFIGSLIKNLVKNTPAKVINWLRLKPNGRCFQLLCSTEKEKKEKYLREPIFDRTEPAQNIVFIIDKHYAVLSS